MNDPTPPRLEVLAGTTADSRLHTLLTCHGCGMQRYLPSAVVAEAIEEHTRHCTGSTLRAIATGLQLLAAVFTDHLPKDTP